MDAASLLTKAVRIREHHYGSDHISVALILPLLGGTHGSLGDHKIEKQMVERALPIKEQYYGSDHIELAGTIGDLGNALDL